MSEDYYISKNVGPTNKPGPQEPKEDIIYILCNNLII